MANRRHTAKTQVPLHERIAAEIRQQLASGTYAAGDRFPSQNELASRYRTSSATAREAVALLVQEGVLERRFGSGTYVTAKRPESFIAVVTELDIAHPAVSPSFLHTIQAARRELAARGKLSRVYIGHAPPFADQTNADPHITSPEFWTDLRAGRIEGMILVGTEPYAGHRAVDELRIPMVDTSGIDGLPLWDVHGLIRDGLRIMGERGCRRVACVENTPIRHRGGNLDVFEQGAVAAALTTCSEWLVPARFVHERGDGAGAFRCLWLARDEKPDGLLVLDDVLYRDMCPALLVNQIRVPQDLLIVTQANADDAQPFVPEPIRLLIDNEAIGAALARNLLLRMRNPHAAPEGIPVPIRIVEPTGGRVETLMMPNGPT